ncbi:MAG: amidohydrolase, partial [Pyrinomonadaceae bacterium]|nr:amidohydrolase [Pyrinomonadaceae bacterium]
FLERRKTSPYVYRKGDDRYVVIKDWHRRILSKHTDVAAKIADMDESGIALTALSINDPGPEIFGTEGPVVSRVVNDYIAEVSRSYPTRFFGLTVLPLQDMRASLDELDRCVNKLGMRGILLYSNLNGKYPDEPEFRPLFARAVELDIPILLHPAYPMTYEATKGYEMAAGLGLMFDTTTALTRIILAGILERHPKLKLVCPHVGGALPYLIGRIDHQTQVLKRGAENIRRAPSEYLKQVYLDTVTPIPLAIRYAYDFVGPDRLLFASDHPWVDPKLIVENIKSLNFPAEDERKIFEINARRLFKLQ